MTIDSKALVRATLTLVKNQGEVLTASYTGIIGLVIAVLRREKGFSQSQLAVASGVSQPTISRIEVGDADPTASQVDALAAALGTKSAVIFETAEQFRVLLRKEKIEVPAKNDQIKNSLIGASAVVVTGTILGGPIGFLIGSVVSGIIVNSRDKSKNK